MKKKYILPLLIVGLLTGCTSASGVKGMETMENESVSSMIEIESVIDVPVKK